MALPIQASLLTVFERKSDALAGSRPTRVDVRFIFATNRDLEAEWSGALFAKISTTASTRRGSSGSLGSGSPRIEPLARKFIAEVSKEDGRASPPALSPAASTS